jgi:hypothetical protein
VTFCKAHFIGIIGIIRIIGIIGIIRIIGIIGIIGIIRIIGTIGIIGTTGISKKQNGQPPRRYNATMGHCPLGPNQSPSRYRQKATRLYKRRMYSYTLH